MIQTVGALAPVFLLILGGYVIRRKALLPDAFWSPAENLTYYAFFPALLVVSIAGADLAGLSVAPMAGALVCGVLIVTGFALWAKPLLRADNAVFTSFFQGTIRPNTYVGIAAATALFGEAGIALTAVAIVFVVPLVNILSVTMLIRYRTKAEGEVERSARALILRELTRNPIVLACLFGGLLNIANLGIPPVISPLLDILGHAALPVGLLAVGAGLDLDSAHRHAPRLALAGLFKLILLPAATFIACLAFGVEGVTLSVALLYAALPVSASSYVLARRMGGDGPTMAGVITITTIAAAATLPALIIALP